MPEIKLSYTPPSGGWLTLNVKVDDKIVTIDASNVPNDPVQELLAALEQTVQGDQSRVWWNLEPDGYFMHFIPQNGGVQLRIEYAPRSEASRGTLVLAVEGSREQVLLPFWRFLREFQSHGFQEPHWRSTDFSRISTVKAGIVE